MPPMMIYHRLTFPKRCLRLMKMGYSRIIKRLMKIGIVILLLIVIYWAMSTQYKHWIHSDGGQQLWRVDIVAECQSLYRPQSFTDTWLYQHLEIASVFTFSSYFEQATDAGYSYVAILGMSKGNAGLDVFCQLWCGSGINAFATVATVEYLPEDHGNLYHAIVIHCGVPNSCLPDLVSIVSQTCDQPQNSISISKNNPQTTQNASHQFTVCVTPVNNNYNRANELIEMIEVNRILGVNYFVFYNYSTGPDVDKVLYYYATQGLVSVISWALPVGAEYKREEVEIHYYGQVISLNDCRYRNRGTSKYIVYTDLDEFIVPRIHPNLNSLVENLSHDNVGAFMFRMSYFRKDWPSSNISRKYMEQARKYKLVTLLKTTREVFIWPIKARSKVIIDPLVVENLGIHEVWRFKNTTLRQYEVPPDVGLLQHYRDLQGKNDSGIEDQHMLVYSDKIISHVTEVWEHLKDVCNINIKYEINCDENVN